jgi:hypothetical protein
MVEEVVAAQKKVRFDRCHVSSLVDSATRLEVVYFVLDADYNLYMDTQQAIYLEVLRRFAADNVHLATKVYAIGQPM